MASGSKSEVWGVRSRVGFLRGQGLQLTVRQDLEVSDPQGAAIRLP